MTAVQRRGACPSLSAPMQTGDGLLVRLNPVIGIAPETLVRLAEAAQRHGNGILEITARGSLQLRGLTAASAVSLADDVNRLAIAVRTGVPVETGPLAGVDPYETTDASALTQALRSAIAATDLASRLGPKVSVVIDGGGQLPLDDVIADVRLTASGDGQWALAIGGDGRSARLLSHGDEAGVPSRVIALLEVIAARGLTARARDLDEDTVPTALRGQSRPSDASPTSPIGALPLKHGKTAIGVGLPYGQATAEELSRLMGHAQQLGATEIRFAPGRALLVLGLDAPAQAAFQSEAKALGFIIDAADPRAHIAACAGAGACASGNIHTREIAADIVARRGSTLDGSFQLHISGCGKRCAQPRSPSIGLIADAEGTGLYLEDESGSLLLRRDTHASSAELYIYWTRSRISQDTSGETTLSFARRSATAGQNPAFQQGS